MSGLNSCSTCTTICSSSSWHRYLLLRPGCCLTARKVEQSACCPPPCCPPPKPDSSAPVSLSQRRLSGGQGPSSAGLHTEHSSLRPSSSCGSGCCKTDRGTGTWTHTHTHNSGLQEWRKSCSTQTAADRLMPLDHFDVLICGLKSSAFNLHESFIIQFDLSRAAEQRPCRLKPRSTSGAS